MSARRNRPKSKYEAQSPPSSSVGIRPTDSGSANRRGAPATVAHQWLILLGILLVAALLRGLYLHDFSSQPDYAYLDLDARYHDYWSQSLVTGDWSLRGQAPDFHDPQIREQPYFRPPGYPYFLAFVRMLTGLGYTAPRIIQTLLGLFSCYLTFVLGRRWFGASVGLIAAAVMSCYWVFIYYEGEFLEPVLLVPLSLLLVYFLGIWSERLHWIHALAAGVTWGLLVLVRPTFMPVGLMVVFWMFWVARRQILPRGRFLRHTCLFFAVGIPLIGSATLRNYLVAQDLVLVSANGGVNFYFGNNPQANGYTPSTTEFGSWSCDDYPYIVKRLESELGRPLKYSEVSSHFSSLGWKYIKEHPLKVFRLTMKKALLFWGPKEISNEREDEYVRLDSRILRWLPLRFSLIFTLAIVGTIMVAINARRCRRSPQSTPIATRKPYPVFVLMLLLIATYFVFHLPFIIAGRYRVPIIPFLIILGAYAVVEMVGMIRQRTLGRLAGWAVACLAIRVLVGVNYTGYQPDKAHWHYQRGLAYNGIGQTEAAVHEYEQTLRFDPNHPEARHNLATIINNQAARLEDNRQFEQAIQEYLKALKLEPDYGIVHFNLARNYYKTERYDEAMTHSRKAKETNPDLHQASQLLAEILLHQNRTEEAIKVLNDALNKQPDEADLHFYLGRALSRKGDNPNAMAAYRKTIQLKPDYAVAHNNLAVLLYGDKKYEEAWKHIHLSQKYGYACNPNFIREISNVMPEPPRQP